MRWLTSGVLLALLFLAALPGSSGSAQSPSPDPTPPPPSTGLASVVPQSIGGIPATWIEELSGPEALDPSSLIRLPTWPAVLDALGKDPQDLEVAHASFEAPASGASVVLVALRVAGVGAAVLNLADAQAAAAARGSDDPFLTAVYVLADSAQTVGSRLVWVQPGSTSEAWGFSYPADDVLFWVAGLDVPMEQVLAALPEGGSGDRVPATG